MSQPATLIKSKEGYVKPERGQVAVYWSPLDYTDIFDAVGFEFDLDRDFGDYGGVECVPEIIYPDFIEG